MSLLIFILNAVIFQFFILWLFADRSKNFEKSGEYATAWKKDEDGKMGVDGPRVVVGDQSQVPQAGYITRFAKMLHFSYLSLSLAECLQLYVYVIRSCIGWTIQLWY